MVNLATVKQKVADADAKQGTGGLLTKKVDIAAKSLLRKKVNPNQIWQVYGIVDCSGSMLYEFEKGVVQDVVNRMLGFAVIVDDDGSVPLIVFDDEIRQYEVSLNEFHNYLSTHGVTTRRRTTNLTGALETLARETGNGDLVPSRGGFFNRGGGSPTSRKSQEPPVYAIIVTDGCPDDPRSATDMIRRLSYRSVFLKFLYVGNDRDGWAYLETLDDDLPVGVPFERGGRLVDNVDAKNVGNIGAISDDDFYDKMFDEVPTWLQAARANDLI